MNFIEFLVKKNFEIKNIDYLNLLQFMFLKEPLYSYL